MNIYQPVRFFIEKCKKYIYNDLTLTEKCKELSLNFIWVF